MGKTLCQRHGRPRLLCTLTAALRRACRLRPLLPARPQPAACVFFSTWLQALACRPPGPWPCLGDAGTGAAARSYGDITPQTQVETVVRAQPAC